MGIDVSIGLGVRFDFAEGVVLVGSVACTSGDSFCSVGDLTGAAGPQAIRWNDVERTNKHNKLKYFFIIISNDKSSFHKQNKLSFKKYLTRLNNKEITVKT
jgi:hypothetical protein